MAEFDCPRCATRVSEEFYGPCTSCRADLVTGAQRERREIAVDEYSPKMNVTPNAVALKDD